MARLDNPFKFDDGDPGFDEGLPVQAPIKHLQPLTDEEQEAIKFLLSPEILETATGATEVTADTMLDALEQSIGMVNISELMNVTPDLLIVKVKSLKRKERALLLASLGAESWD